MLWREFYDLFWDWSDSTRKSRISSLEDIGAGEEIVEAVLEIEDSKVKAQLVRKAMKLGAEFTQEDFMNLDGEVSEELYVQLGEYSGFDADDPYFDEDNMDWDDFYNCWSNWGDEVLLRRIRKLSKFGSAEEVADVIVNMPTSEMSDLLYEKALKYGVRFTEEQLDEMGEWYEVQEDAPTDQAVLHFEENVRKLTSALGDAKNNSEKSCGFFATLMSAPKTAANKRKHCDGDCANCPLHFGYRYGRWYYGRGHQYGCMRGGNGGAKGKVNIE